MRRHPETYLNQFQDSGQIQLIGPLAGPHVSIVEPVIFVDGGTRRRQTGIGISVGDGDSSSETMDFSLDPDKDFSDLAFALSLVSEHFNTVLLQGFLGGRRDHELFNLGEVHHFLSPRKSATQAMLDSTIGVFSAGNWEFEVSGLFSLAVFSVTTVSLSGQCKFPIAAGTSVQPVSSFGLSNIGQGKVLLECDAPVFIFYPENL